MNLALTLTFDSTTELLATAEVLAKLNRNANEPAAPPETVAVVEKPREPKAAPEPVAETKTDPSPAEHTAADVSQAFREYFGRCNAEDSTTAADKCKALLAAYGVDKVSDVPADKYGEFMAAVSA